MMWIATVLILNAIAQPETPSDELRGPVVETKASPATLLERDFQGHLRRLEVPAEEAALGKLSLSESEKQGTERILTERAAVLDGIVGGNVELLLRISTAKEAGNKPELHQAVSELIKLMEPLRQRGKLVDELAGQLSEANGAELRRLTREYWMHVIDEEHAKAPKGTRRGEIQTREVLAAVGMEVRRAYETRISGKQEELEQLITALELTPEQEGKVRAIALDFAQKTLAKPTGAQKRELFMRLNKELTPAQRLTLLKHVYRPVSER
jgi:hypothetical protein